MSPRQARQASLKAALPSSDVASPMHIATSQEWRGLKGLLGLCRRLLGGTVFRLMGIWWSWFQLHWPILSFCISGYVHLLIFSFTIRGVSFLLYPLVWDWISYWYFWWRSVRHSTHLVLQDLERFASDTTATSDSSEDCSTNGDADPPDKSEQRLTPPPVWRHRSRLMDLLASRAFKWHLGGKPLNERELRTCLAYHPPAFPVCSHDYFWLQDTPENRCEILGHALVDRLSIDQLRQLVWERWVLWEPKFISLLGHQWGKQCWVPLKLSQSNLHSKSSDLFSLSDHVYQVDIDLSQKSVYEYISELASETLPANKPRWRLILANPTQNTHSSDKCADEVHTEIAASCQSFSCLILQIHHGMGDGYAIAYGLVGRLFDQTDQTPKPSTGGRLNDWKFLRQRGLTAIYYGWNVLKCAMFGVRILLFWLVWCAKPPATFQPYTSEPKKLAARPLPNGRKHLSPPVILCPKQMQEVRDRIAAKSKGLIKPTINDILAYCLSLVVGRLRDGSVAKELREKAIVKRSLGHVPECKGFQYVTPKAAFRRYSRGAYHLPLPVSHIVEGAPLEPCDLVDMSTPTALSNRIGRGTFRPGLNPFQLPLTGLRRRPSFPGTENMCSPVSKGVFSSGLTSPCTSPLDTSPAALVECRNTIPSLTSSEIHEFLSKPDPTFHPYCGGFEDYLQLLIPMATRTSIPTGFDNFTGPVLLRLPLFQYTRRRWRAPSGLKARDQTLLLALRHLQHVKSEIDWIKKQNAGPVYFLLTCLAVKVFPDWISKRVVTSMNNRMQLVLTNVRGPEAESKVGNKRIHALQFWPPAKGDVTSGISILSYKGNLQIFSIFDEAEFAGIFSAAEYEALAQRDFAAMSQFVSNLVKTEFLTLHDLLLKPHLLEQEHDSLIL
eukprot:Blabericola_migrator_1__11992@NODE_735_length_6690_cov_180_559112_g528_i0_p2_GENE_NODE_735_length_6690_cov_180_559112_g528_i0NODE_735_length_6690_cov_180_559112_g528_i0_p2_ORF_typecomplete_len892_score99_74DUF1298/PF06974_13/3_6e15WES_acyltransf/PF03007_16/2_1e10DUF3967/PF13152_6/2_6e03DUF3967/PF13152_6/0_65_NODE_735_length_6690_cov_180_559112_g528_i09313606